MKTPTRHFYTVDDYEIYVRYESPEGHPEQGCYTARVAAMPGIIAGAVTPEAALSECRALLADFVKCQEEEDGQLAHPEYRPPDRYADALAKPLVTLQVKAVKNPAASALGKLGGAAKSARKAASSRANLAKARAEGKKGGRPRKVKDPTGSVAS